MYNIPPEILSAICAAIYESSIPTETPQLDPVLFHETSNPTSIPSAYPSSNWSEPTTRKTLANLSLVSRDWYNAARPYLWRHVEVRLPRSWLAFIEEVAGGDLDAQVIPETVQRQDKINQTRCPDSPIIPSVDSIPLELLSPAASRDPSPGRMRASSPGRWHGYRAFSDAIRQALDWDEYISLPDDPRPGRHVRHLDFNHFRTIGMRRSVEEGVRSRFVTAERVVRVLKEMPRLTGFGATEYMDGALNKTVLVELLLRGRALQYREQTGRGREYGPQNQPSQVQSLDDGEVERLQECQGLEALDFCGCVSSVFVQGIDELVKEYFDDGVAEDGTRAPSQIAIPSLKRLGLRGVASVPSHVLTPFVLACTSLTQLDLSGTRCTSDLLAALADSSSVRLTALALGRCPRLTSESIADFLVDGLPARTITQLSLYGDATFSSQLTEGDMTRIVTQAPCFKSGKLEYLDLSSCPINAQLLQLFVPQLLLRSLGLSYITSLDLKTIRDFVLNSAPNVEVLTLVSTSPELAVPCRELPLSLHSLIIQPLCAPPFHFSLTSTIVPKPAPTRLRVVELGVGALYCLGAGADSWKIVKSKGGRGWYVDTASGWENGRLRRDLPAGHPMRVELERLAGSNGNVSSGVGWHARKMEVLYGQGMLGREDGLYGAVSFAYQG